MVVYADTVDGAVVAFEDFFKFMAWEFGNFYKGSENEAKTDAEVNAALDNQLRRTMMFVDREALGREKVIEIVSAYGFSSYLLGQSETESVASRDGVVKSADGTVTITDDHLFYVEDGKLKPRGDGTSSFTLKYKADTETWVVVDTKL